MSTPEKALLVVFVASLISLVVVLVILGMYAIKLNRKNKITKTVRKLKGEADSSNLKFCFIINPSKKGADDLKLQIIRYFKYRNLLEPIFKETTVLNPGNLQAIEAVNEGIDIIVACGGDGTVRSVACGLAKSTIIDQVQMAIIPIGTGNLLARNLSLPVNDLELALDIAVYGKPSSIDLGWCVKDDDFENPHAFTVIAGVGFDANLVRGTDPKLKKRIGFLAYFLSGLKEAFAKKFDTKIELEIDGTIKTVESKLRSVMIGNCGRIPGFKLIPNANFSDGLLDIVAVDTTAGVLGWGQIATDVFLQNFGITIDSKFKFGRIDHIQAKKVHLILNEPQEVDVDGDLIGKAKSISFFLDPRALSIRIN